MTFIERKAAAPPPMITRLGLAVPGLGHLATGRVVTGIGLLLLDALLAVAAYSGFTRLDAVLFWGPLHQPSTHGFIAVAAWIAIAGMTWYPAARLAFPPAQDDEQKNAITAVFLRQFARNRTGMIGLFGAGLMVATVLLTPLIAPFDPDEVGVGGQRLAPGWYEPEAAAPGGPESPPPTGKRMHLMGTDQYGRDMFSRVLYGGRISLVIGFIAVGLAATIGVTIGAIAGYAGGWVDRGLMWVVDLLLSLPSLVLLLAIVGLFRVSGVESVFLIVTILGLTGWMSVSRIVRGQVLSLKQQDFIQAARAVGMSPARIVFRHLVPNAFAPVIVYCSLAVGSTILVEASLSFLGLGVSPPTSTWGTLVNDGREQIKNAPWIFLFPGLFIALSVMSFSLLGDGLRDTLDPKLRGR